jgi:hypothetical protein
VEAQEERERQRALKALARLGYAVTLAQVAASAGVEYPNTIPGGLLATHAVQWATTQESGVSWSQSYSNPRMR